MLNLPASYQLVVVGRTVAEVGTAPSVGQLVNLW